MRAVSDVYRRGDRTEGEWAKYLDGDSCAGPFDLEIPDQAVLSDSVYLKLWLCTVREITGRGRWNPMAFRLESHTESPTYSPRCELSDSRKNGHSWPLVRLLLKEMRQSNPNFSEVQVCKQRRWNKLGERIVPDLEI
jgi:hypothetical protein